MAFYTPERFHAVTPTKNLHITTEIILKRHNSWSVSSAPRDSSWHIKGDSFHLSVSRTKCAWEWGRRIKIVGCQRHTMHQWWRNNGRRWPRTHLRVEQRKQRAGQKRKTKMTGGEKGQKRMKHSIFFVIFKCSNSHRNSRGWVTEWLFYYVADWPQPSNIWTCMCGSFLQALLLIISVLLVTFSFSRYAFSFPLCLNGINTLYLDTPQFVFPLCTNLFVLRIKITLDASWKCHVGCFHLICFDYY